MQEFEETANVEPTIMKNNNNNKVAMIATKIKEEEEVRIKLHHFT